MWARVRSGRARLHEIARYVWPAWKRVTKAPGKGARASNLRFGCRESKDFSRIAVREEQCSVRSETQTAECLEFLFDLKNLPGGRLRVLSVEKGMERAIGRKLPDATTALGADEQAAVGERN